MKNRENTSQSLNVSLTRPENESLLAEELTAVSGARPAARENHPELSLQGSGWLAWSLPADHPVPPPFILERQRLPRAEFVPGRQPAPLAERLLERVPSASNVAAHLQVFTPNPNAAVSLERRSKRLRELLQKVRPLQGEGSDAGNLPAPPTALVWQVCVVEEGAWSSLARTGELVSPHPGGIPRLEGDRAAPSRSYLKLEEALDVMGWAPRVRERAVDLGAAPGGWSYALLKRGCNVLAVDNGPLKIKALEALPGRLIHLRSDGLRFQPPADWIPADWLLADMLIPPGVCLGLLRKWIGNRWMRRFIVNVKLPQQHPLGALLPLRDFLSDTGGLHVSMRQLFHDRREITVMGELHRPPVRHPRASRAAPGETAPRRAAKPGARRKKHRR